jgi:DNA modification methylase
MLLNNEEKYHIEMEDCIEHMSRMPAQSIDFSCFSPPFPSLFSYTSLECDIGNSDDLDGESKIHLSYFYRGLSRVLKPGRVAVVHVMQIPGLIRNQEKGTYDFRGLNIRLARRAGLIYQYDWLVRKNPQAQAIRTHSHKLLFVSLERDRTISCGALGDYLIKFFAPGENQTPVDSNEIKREDWTNWAESAWMDIRETDTLNVSEGRGENDTKHICPLQLEVIRRLILLYTNPGEIVFTPFAGIGSEIYQALLLGRRAYGCEIKYEYFQTAIKNAERAIKKRNQAQLLPLFPETIET